jgi:hypothetical protein
MKGGKPMPQDENVSAESSTIDSPPFELIDIYPNILTSPRYEGLRRNVLESLDDLEKRINHGLHPGHSQCSWVDAILHQFPLVEWSEDHRTLKIAITDGVISFPISTGMPRFPSLPGERRELDIAVETRHITALASVVAVHGYVEGKLYLMPDFCFKLATFMVEECYKRRISFTLDYFLMVLKTFLELGAEATYSEWRDRVTCVIDAKVNYASKSDRLTTPLGADGLLSKDDGKYLRLKFVYGN